MKHLTVSMMAVALIATSSPAYATTVITFEEPVVTAMSNSPGAAVPVAAQVKDQYADKGVKFTSGAGYAAVANHGFPTLTPTPPNILGGTNANGTLNYAALIRATFFMPSSNTKATTNFVKVLGELFGLGSGTVTLNAYGVNGNLLGSVTDTDNKPLGQGPVLAFTGTGIHYVELTGTSGTVGFDNFEFGALTAVPEPATWAMMIMGFGLIGGALRSRKANVTTRVRYA